MQYVSTHCTHDLGGKPCILYKAGFPHYKQVFYAFLVFTHSIRESSEFRAKIAVLH